MRLGLFLMPSHPPERSLEDGQEWDLQVIRWADELGYDEAWIGEHFTSPWEPNPSPDIVIAQALLQTKRIKLAPGAHLLPYHHPAELACRVALMDHLARGRYMLGIGASGLPSDWQFFNVDGVAGENREMTREALDIMLKVWETEGGLDYEGKYWHVNVPEAQIGPPNLRHHIKPYQQPHPPIGIAGFSPSSATLKLAGERGFIPLSLNLSPQYVATHWDAVLEGARTTGRSPSREEWRIVKEIFVAPTDEEALQLATSPEYGIGRMMKEYFLPLFKDFGFLQYYREDPNVSDEETTAEYLAQNGWLVGSPQTVTRKLDRMWEQLGGFGVLLVFTFDYVERPDVWHRSMKLLAEEVLPHFVNRQADAGAAVAGGGQ